MSTPTVASALQMHRALLIASRLVSRAAASVAYTAQADCHPQTAKDLADLTVELDAMGYIDPLPDNQSRGRA